MKGRERLKDEGRPDEGRHTRKKGHEGMCVGTKEGRKEGMK